MHPESRINSSQSWVRSVGHCIRIFELRYLWACGKAARKSGHERAAFSKSARTTSRKARGLTRNLASLLQCLNKILIADVITYVIFTFKMAAQMAAASIRDILERKGLLASDLSAPTHKMSAFLFGKTIDRDAGIDEILKWWTLRMRAIRESRGDRRDDEPILVLGGSPGTIRDSQKSKYAGSGKTHLLDVLPDKIRERVEQLLLENPDDQDLRQIKEILDDIVYVPITFNSFTDIRLELGQSTNIAELEKLLSTRMIFRQVVVVSAGLRCLYEQLLLQEYK